MVVAGALTLGLLVSIVSASAWYGYVGSLRRQSVASAVGNVKSILGTSLERDKDLVATVNALLATHPATTNRSLGAVLSRLEIPQQYPGTLGISYVQSVSAAHLAKFEAAAALDPFMSTGTAPKTTGPVARSFIAGSNYCLTRLAVPETSLGGGSPESLLVAWALPFVSARFNLCASTFEEELGASARMGTSEVLSLNSLFAPAGAKPTGSGALRALVAHIPIFIELSPVYAGARPPMTPRDRARALTGWTFGMFAADGILEPAVANEKGVAVALAYASRGAKPAVLARAGQPQPGAVTEDVPVPGDPGWSVDLAVNPQASGSSPLVQGLVVLIGTAALTVLLVALLNLLIASRRSALQLVDERTAELRYQALHDSLTGLPNRLLVDETARALLRRARDEGLPVAAFFIDLDDFKKVNDTLGHGAGDELLRAVAVRLSGVLGSVSGASGTVGRLGGDEFVVLSAGPPLDEGLDIVAEKLLAVLAEPFSLGETTTTRLTTSASIGIAAGLRDGPEELLRDADIAMYKAKFKGKSCYVVFEPEMHELAKRQLALETDLADAFANQEFFLVYQPIVDLGTGFPTHVEALIRWRHPSRGIVAPNQFIPVLESSGLITDVGRFVLDEACRQVKVWHDRGLDIGISVNVAARQLHYDVLIDHVRHALEAAALEPRYLTIEVTESMLMVDTKITARRLSALADLGVHIAIDDFGTGYASLSYLREFPAEVLKIDKSFVTHRSSSNWSGGTNFLDALVHLGRSLGLRTLAEGVEEPSQLRHLQAEGCELGQGFLFSRPLPAEEIERVLVDMNRSSLARLWPAGEPAAAVRDLDLSTARQRTGS
jgi:diguanylate cyclase (GGDEF)-like protein